MKSIVAAIYPLVSIAAFTSCGSHQAPISIPIRSSALSLSGNAEQDNGSITSAKIEHGIIERVNHIRGGSGLSRDTDLDLLARMHNRYMILHQDELSMNGPDTSYAALDGRRAASYRLFGFDHTSENVATVKAGSRFEAVVHSVVKLWNSQEDNKESMLDPTWNRTGISVMEGKDGYLFVTQIYGKKSFTPNAMERRNFGL